ncbi:MAG: hypothetical protein ACXADY_18310 [Candidatus Hodarchaeales archaeon]|jgi:predicted metal-dependent RNase
MTSIEGNFGAKISCSKFVLEKDSEYFKRIKQELMHQCGQFLIPQIIDSGEFHVINMNLYRDESLDTMTFYLRGTHSLAQRKYVVYPEMLDIELPITARECCQWCGNVLCFDKQGGCSACGGNPSTVKDGRMQYYIEEN